MFRVVVFNFKNVLKNIIKLIIIFLFFIGIRNVIAIFRESVSSFDYKKIINKNIYFLNEENEKDKYQDILDIAFLTSSKTVINSENVVKIENDKEINVIKEDEKIENIDNIVNDKMIENEEDVIKNINIDEYKTEYVKTETQIVSENNIKESYNIVYDTVKIKNESKYTLTNEILTPNIEFSNKEDIIIFHTHTCESYTPTEKFSYLASGNFRTVDMNYSVARVGSELTNYLEGKGFAVLHLMDLHDYPAYNGSYNRSYSTVSNALKNNSSSLVIDLHRDAVGSKSDYAPAVYIGEEKVAQLMFVIGTNGGGLSHNNWNANLKLAIKIQQKANEMYPRII